jgi:anti-sigma B factor antagonist
MMPEIFTVDEATEFRKNVYGMIDSGTREFMLDFSKCTFIDSTGLGVLVSAYKKCAEFNGSFRLRSVNNPNVLRVFRLSRLDKVFDIT